MQTPTGTASQLSERVASEIRAEMARHGIAQSTLAERLGENPQWLSRRLSRRGGIPLSVDDVDRIAKALAIDPLALIERADAGRVVA